MHHPAGNAQLGAGAAQSNKVKRSVFAISALLIGSLGVLIAPSPATANGPPGSSIRPVLCFANSSPGSNADDSKSVIAIVPDKYVSNFPVERDQADQYQLQSDVSGSWTDVNIFDAFNGALNIDDPYIDDVPHYRVRSRRLAAADSHWSSSARTSAWTMCDQYEIISSVSPRKLIDFRRTSAYVYFGLDGLSNGVVSATDRYFDGSDSSVVFVSVDGSDDLSPNGGQFVWRTRFKLGDAAHGDLVDAQGGELSWNIMQRGKADDPGGQWKMSIVSQNDETVRVQCVARDDNSPKQMLKVDSTWKIVANQWTTATCILDDAANTIRVVVNRRTDALNQNDSFGNVDPSSISTCSGNLAATDLLGSVYSIGNKPACPSLTDDDRFRGYVSNAQVWKTP